MKRLMGSAAVGVMALLLAACIPPYEGKEGGPRVGVLGDSVTSISSGHIDQLLRFFGWRVSMVAEPSKRVEEMQDYATQYADTDPDIMVINLGTNDALHSPEDAIAELEQMWAKFPNACQVPVTIAETTTVTHFDEAASQINDWIYSNFPEENIADWADVHANNSNITHNSVHPNSEGASMLAWEIGAAVGKC